MMMMEHLSYVERLRFYKYLKGREGGGCRGESQIPFSNAQTRDHGLKFKRKKFHWTISNHFCSVLVTSTDTAAQKL